MRRGTHNILWVANLFLKKSVKLVSSYIYDFFHLDRWSPTFFKNPSFISFLQYLKGLLTPVLLVKVLEYIKY